MKSETNGSTSGEIENPEKSSLSFSTLQYYHKTSSNKSSRNNDSLECLSIYISRVDSPLPNPPTGTYFPNKKFCFHSSLFVPND